MQEVKSLELCAVARSKAASLRCQVVNACNGLKSWQAKAKLKAGGLVVESVPKHRANKPLVCPFLFFLFLNYYFFLFYSYDIYIHHIYLYDIFIYLYFIYMIIDKYHYKLLTVLFITVRLDNFVRSIGQFCKIAFSVCFCGSLSEN